MLKLTKIAVLPLVLAGCQVSTPAPVSLDVPGFAANNSTLPGGHHFNTISYAGNTGAGGMSASISGASTGPGTFSQNSSITNLGTAGAPSGNATFAGNYVASYVDLNIDQDLLVVFGDANLNYNFAGSTITGTIANRKFLTPNGPGTTVFLNDVTLTSSAVNVGSGVFSGSTAGGTHLGLTQSGSGSNGYNGQIGGTAGSDVAGQVFLDFTYTTGEHVIENGVFLAN
ncbi:MAG: hypothetical protein V3V25_03900 [Paracoccaceae bacterium]